MTKKMLFFCLLILSVSNLFSQQSDLPKLTGPYLGQKPPGNTPEIFAPGILSTDANEFNAAFTPDGTQLYFTVVKDVGRSIMMIEFKDGTWGKRKFVPFSDDHYIDVDPFVSPDGKRLYFSSNRTIEGTGVKEDFDFWFVKKKEDGLWGSPQHLEFPSTPGKDDFYITITEEGTIYYSVIDVIDGDRKGSIFRLKSMDGEIPIPELLDGVTSTKNSEHDSFIAPDESYLIFASDRPGGFGSNDLYISFRNQDGTWTVPANLGRDINSAAYDYCPILSPDGKYLFFSSTRTGNGDVYWVSAKIIEELRKN
jgi:WD40-like Beta Propeller Repeat